MKLNSLRQIVSIVNAARAADNALRKQGENKLLHRYNNHPNQTVEQFIDLICMNIDEAALLIADSGLGLSTQTTLLKSFICVQLQNLVTIKNTRSTYPYVWEHLRPELQGDFKQKLLLFLQQNFSIHTSPLIRKITRLIGCLAADLIHQNTNSWPQFPHMVFHFIQKDIKCAFYVLESFFEEKSQRFKEIVQNMGSIFQQFLDQQEDPSVLLPALLCFNSYLKVTTEQKTTENIKFSGEKVIKAIHVYHSQQYTQCQHQCVLVLLKIMLETHPNFFQKDFEFILTFFQEFLSQKPDQQHKDIVSETIVGYCESSPIVFQQNPQNLQILLELIISHMLPDTNIDDEWKQPPEGFDIQETDNNFDRNNRTALNILVRVMRAVGYDHVLKPIVKIVNYMLAKDQAREDCHYYGLMILSQLGECFQSIDHINNYIFHVAQTLKHENPLLRHAAIHVLGKFSDGSKSFFNLYGEKFYLVLVPMLCLEEVPRVRAQILATLTNLLKNLEFKVIEQNYFQRIVKRIFQLARSDISIVKQNAYVTISGFIEVATINFIPYLQDYFNMFFQLFSSGHYNRYEYNNLKGLALETTEYVLCILGAQHFRPYLKRVLTILEGFKQMNHSTPPFKNILKLWKQLCAFYKEQLSPVIISILPSLLETITNNIKQAIATCQQLEEEYNNKMQSQRLGIDDFQAIENYEIEEVVAGVQVATTFSQYIPCMSDNYYGQILTIFILILEKYPNTKVQDETVAQIPKFISHIPDKNQQIIRAKHFISLIIVLLQSQNETQITPQKFKSINNILQTIPQKIFSPPELKIFNSKIINQYNKRIIRIKQLIAYSQDASQDELAEIRSVRQKQNKIMELIQELFQTVVKTYNIQAFQIAKFLVDNVVIKIITDENNSNSIKAGLQLLSGVIEHMGYEFFSHNLWSKTSRKDLKECIIRLDQMEPQAGEFRNIMSSDVWEYLKKFLLQ